MKLRASLMALAAAFLVSVFPVVAHEENATILITPDGFEPQTVTVDVGSLVNFLNKNAAPHWPASDFHPTHSLYPEFDPDKPIPPGDVWGFRAERTGQWKYHDHLNPHLKGTLVVEAEDEAQEPSTKVETKAEEGMVERIRIFFRNLVEGLRAKIGSLWKPKTNQDDGAFGKLSPGEQVGYLEKTAREKGPEAAWQLVLRTFQNESGTTGNIHDLAHQSGGLMYEIMKWEGLVKCTPKFGFGCYHGFFDHAFAQSLSGLSLAEENCRKVGSVGSGPFGSCIHGIGHGVASFFKANDLTSALLICEKLSEGQQFCFDGVFMEFERGAKQSFYHEEDPLYPCSTLEEKYNLSCGRNQPNVLMGRFGKSFAEVSAVCLGSSSEGAKQGCQDSLGFIAAGQSRGDPNRVVSLCRSLADSTAVANCLIKAAGEFIFQETPGWQQSAPKVCQTLSGSELKNCQDYLRMIIRDYGRDDFSALIRPKRDGESDQDYIQAQMGVCFRTGGRDVCYEKAAAALWREFGLRKTLALFHEAESQPEVYSRCHEATHYLSREEFKKEKSVAGVYSSCDSTCHGGCYHGALEQYLKDEKVSLADFNAVAVKITSVCEPVRDGRAPIIYYECVHGLGHAAMFVTDMDLPGSLKICDLLPDPANQDRCHSGAFMENSSSSTNNDHPGRFVKADDPLFPCNTLEGKYLSTCYRYQSSYFLVLGGYNWPKVIGLCQLVPEQYQRECFRMVGSNQVGYTTDPQVWKKDCDLIANADFRSVCVSGVVSALSYRFVGQPEKMFNFCALVDDAQKRPCYTQIGLGVRDWSSDQSEAISVCQQISSPVNQEYCKSKLS